MLDNQDPKTFDVYWVIFHKYSTAYPDKPTLSDKNDAINYYENFFKQIPCEKCRKHYVDNIKKNPLTAKDLQSKQNLFLWTVRFHNIVNTMLHKRNITVDEAQKLVWENNMKNAFNIYKLLFYILLLIIIIYISYVYTNSKILPNNLQRTLMIN